MKELIIIFGLPICFVAVVLVSNWCDKLCERNRRKKHPLYFEVYDAAMKICFDASAKASKEADYLKFQFNLLTEGLKEGECTEEYFKKHFDQLADKHIEVTKWFTEQQKEAEKLFRQADAYAKRNNLLWGVLY